MNNNYTNINERIRNVLFNEVLAEEKITDFNDDKSLIDEINLDSIQLLQLIASLEQEFKIEFTGEDLMLDVFENVNTIAKYIETHFIQGN